LGDSVVKDGVKRQRSSIRIGLQGRDAQQGFPGYEGNPNTKKRRITAVEKGADHKEAQLGQERKESLTSSSSKKEIQEGK